MLFLHLMFNRSTMHAWTIVISICFALAGLPNNGWTQETSAQDDTTGLWLGIIRADKVSEPHSPAPDQPRPTGSVFQFPIILHVSETEKVKLLKEAIILPPDGGQTSATLLADPARLPNAGKGLDEARRFATAAMDFPGASLRMKGRFKVGDVLTAEISLDSQVRTHPFAHRYHPDHDNLDDAYAPLPKSRLFEEIYTIERTLELKLVTHQGEQVRGTYRERLSGLHKDDLFVSGTFRLERIARIAKIKQ